MSRRRTARALIVAVAGLLVGCTAPVASGSPIPSGPAGTASAAPSVTLNPNQLAVQSGPPSHFPSAVSTASPQSTSLIATPRPTQAPLTEMQQRVPALAGGGGASPRVIEPADLFGGSVDQVGAGQRLIDAVGASSDAFEGAGSSCCSVGLAVAAIRIRGVSSGALAAALIEVAGEVEPGSTVTTRTVDGVRITRLRWSSGIAHDLHVAAIDDLVFAFAGTPNRQGDVDATIAFMRRPRLEELLPATIAGHPTIRASVPGSSIPTGGDICFFVCPLEVPNLAKALRVPVTQIDVAYAVLMEPPGVFVLAFRVPTVSDTKLVTARIQSYPTGAAFGQEIRRIGGKSVTWAAPDSFPDSSQHEYLYAHDHVLYSIRPANDEGPPNSGVVEAIAALP